MQCDLCGATKNLVRAKIEGTELIVCQECAKFGTILGPIKTKQEKVKKRKEKKSTTKQTIKPSTEEEILIINPNYPTIIKKAREKLGLKQSEFAKLIREKESVVHKLETGELEPSIKLAKKLEHILKIKLIEQYHEP
ncbi:TIGR00270 family protein [Candidatus Woesearchaeota archaeon]|nr:multiprotein bridging factor aMBF1 [Candidatus Woesearchaeota archaeon]RLE40718.1 MAG: TIGR00270 family protein [Candidatus Woesearchaeota archaeon]